MKAHSPQISHLQPWRGKNVKGVRVRKQAAQADTCLALDIFETPANFAYRGEGEKLT